VPRRCHRLGIQAFQPKLIEGKAFIAPFPVQLNATLTVTDAVHLPLGNEAVLEAHC
jgi:DNA-directed RNA polymerase subunit beta'